MKMILLALSARRSGAAVLDAALAKAEAEGAALHIAYVLDVVAANQAQKRVGEAGFMGEKPCEQLASTIHDEQEASAREMLADAQTHAGAHGCAVTTSITTGPFVDAVLRLIAEVQATDVVIAKRKISKFRRFVEGSSAEVIQRSAPCPVTIIDQQHETHS